MKLKQGLQRIGMFDVEATRRQAEQAGFFTFVLPAEGIVDRGSFFDAVRATFPLDPPLVGSTSWNALSDSLWEGLYKHPAQHIVILWSNVRAMESSARGDFTIALEVLEDVVELLADSHATCGSPKEAVLLVE